MTARHSHREAHGCDQGKVGYFCSYFPREIIYAFDRLPVRVIPTAAGQATADAYLPRNFCSLVKVTLATFLEDAAPHLEGVVFTDSCDAHRRLHDVWREYVDLEVLDFLDLPRLSTPLAQQRFCLTLRRFVARLEARYGQRLTVEALSQAVRVYNRQRELLRALRMKWRQGLVSTLDYYDLRRSVHDADPLVANRDLEAELAPADKEAPTPRGPRLLLVGSLLVNRRLVEVIEETGARVVAEDSCADGRELDQRVREEGSLEEILRDLAASYLSKPPCPRMRNLPARLSYLSRTVAEGQVNGVICCYYKFCDLFLAEFPVLKEEMGRLGLPVLLLEDEGESRLSGQSRTRVEAFLEMLRDGNRAR